MLICRFITAVCHKFTDQCCTWDVQRHIVLVLIKYSLLLLHYVAIMSPRKTTFMIKDALFHFISRSGMKLWFYSVVLYFWVVTLSASTIVSQFIILHTSVYTCRLLNIERLHFCSNLARYWQYKKIRYHSIAVLHFLGSNPSWVKFLFIL